MKTLQKREEKEIANNVLHFFGAGGYQGGSFTSSLLDTFSKADSNNTMLLGLVYPVHANLFTLASDTVDGIEKIREIAQQ